MNRREFCLTTGLLLAGSVCNGAMTPRAVGRSEGFRAQKVFLESCREDASFVRKRLEAIRRDRCDGLLLVPGRYSASGWTEQIVAEARRLELSVFVPARLNGGLFHQAQTTVPLVYTDGVLRCLDGTPADDGGLLLLNGSDDVLALVLYDKSRCRWTSFAPMGTIADFESANDLVTARWLDRQMGRYAVNEDKLLLCTVKKQRQSCE